MELEVSLYRPRQQQQLKHPRAIREKCVGGLAAASWVWGRCLAWHGGSMKMVLMLCMNMRKKVNLSRIELNSIFQRFFSSSATAASTIYNSYKNSELCLRMKIIKITRLIYSSWIVSFFRFYFAFRSVFYLDSFFLWFKIEKLSSSYYKFYVYNSLLIDYIETKRKWEIN